MSSNFIHPTSIIYPNVELGENNYIGPYCVIGAPAESRGNWGQQGKVIIGNNNRFTGLVTIDGGMEDVTVIGNDCFIMKKVHIGHDCHIEANVTISPGATIGGHARIMEWANVGMNAVIHQWQVIGGYTMIGMGAAVHRNLKVIPFVTYLGNPAKVAGPNIKWQDIPESKKETERQRFDLLVANTRL